jgi:hypothetical protein
MMPQVPLSASSLEHPCFWTPNVAFTRDLAARQRCRCESKTSMTRNRQNRRVACRWQDDKDEGER